MRINFDIIDKNFELYLEDIDPHRDYLDVKFSFTESGKQEVKFTNLSFEYSLFEGEIILGTDSYPKENIEYISSDQEYVELSRVFGFRPNRTYSLSISVSNNNEYNSETLTFVFPKPDQTFPSWTWNDDEVRWEAPIPYPGGQGEPFYTWNEEDQSWDIYIPEEES
jgi:hypothetical protein